MLASLSTPLRPAWLHSLVSEAITIVLCTIVTLMLREALVQSSVSPGGYLDALVSASCRFARPSARSTAAAPTQPSACSAQTQHAPGLRACSAHHRSLHRRSHAAAQTGSLWAKGCTLPYQNQLRPVSLREVGGGSPWDQRHAEAALPFYAKLVSSDSTLAGWLHAPWPRPLCLRQLSTVGTCKRPCPSVGWLTRALCCAAVVHGQRLKEGRRLKRVKGWIIKDYSCEARCRLTRSLNLLFRKPHTHTHTLLHHHHAGPPSY